MFAAACHLGLELTRHIFWIKVKNPNTPAATRAVDGTF